MVRHKKDDEENIERRAELQRRQEELRLQGQQTQEEIQSTLKGAQTDIGRLIQEIENQADEKSDQVKQAMAEAVRRAIAQLEKIEERLK